MTYLFSIDDAIKIAEHKSAIDGWLGFEWRRTDGGCTVKGCVPDGVYSRGPRKGQPRFCRPVDGTLKNIVVSDSEMQQFAADYESRTGNCWNCKGAGECFAGWSQKDGLKMAPCKRCGASGGADMGNFPQGWEGGAA